MNKELSFGQIIKEYRRLHDLTQAELARREVVDPYVVCRTAIGVPIEVRGEAATGIRAAGQRQGRY